MARTSKLSDKQVRDFDKRLMKVKKNLPSNWLNQLILSSPTLPFNRALNTYKGNTKDFVILEMMEALI